MDVKAEILDSKGVIRTLTRISHEIIEKNKGVESLILVGIKRRGVPLAERISACIESIENVKVPVTEVDITLYRDDLSQLSKVPVVNCDKLMQDVKGKTVILVDDVVYTGRTVRAAMEAIIQSGRPQNIQLAVLVDRGHRELPIRADYVGKNIPTSNKEMVSVQLAEIDGEDSVKILEQD